MRLPRLLRPLLDYFPGSVRAKLLFLVLAPLMLGFPIIMGLTWYWSHTYYHKLLVFKVGSDLVSAHEYFDRVVADVGNRVEGFADSRRLAAALAHEAPSADRSAPGAAHQGVPGELQVLLEQVRGERGLDYLNVLDVNGRVLRSSGTLPAGAERAHWPLVMRAIREGAASGVEVFEAAELGAIAPALRERARLALRDTPRARADDREEETRGMVIQAAAPVVDARGNLVAVVEGGLLLNGNLAIVDTINAIVYRDGSLPLGSKGTATLFLGDARIATNVRLFAGERALGTRASAEVREHVLEQGHTWLETAFVVNDWYVSGYEPVLDSAGERVGMLYVGFLEAPFRVAKTVALLVIFCLFLLISLAGAVWSLQWARSIFRPIERMHGTIGRIEAGEGAARVGEVGSRDELGLLAREFDRLLDTLAGKREQLQQLAESLDRKVVERTRDLEAANAELRTAQRQLVMTEKLAAIGELTAGVAHEISNPTAVIQGNLELLREELGEHATPVLNEIRLIDEQVNRIRKIVTKLLQFARPGEFAGYAAAVDVNTVLADCLVLTRQHLSRQGVTVRHEPGTLRLVEINEQELQQVLINLIVNAVQAMPAGGTLTLTTADWDERGPGGIVARGVCVTVRDTGQGIRDEDLARIFDPFFTTKKTQGTGLGLSISYSLVERYGGRITVESVPGAGAAFTVWLLTEPEYHVEPVEPARNGGA
ncbi:putative sensor histidine kinase [Azoarcus olearius]|uniref:sensor histidine kinase n=1 Tax=Azoarcus sp. (strain BH72) TaxID=418699 RepID=UPI0008062858|nr:cache domain-containing protein [Azoarcus olearius]ANQ86652.1 putative sensor histidine kinase [Azoarcus olearius]